MNRYQNKYSQAVRSFLGLMLIINIGLPTLAKAAAVTTPLDLATTPLASSSTTPIQPNLLFVLDDSGSMGWNYLPDWADDPLCKKSSGQYNEDCADKPPYRSSDFNAIYYNPEVVYEPAANADGTSKGNITTWTAVKNNAYGALQSPSSTATTNLVTQYDDEEWCTDTTRTDCLRNDNYLLPDKINLKDYNKQYTVSATGTGLVVSGSPDAPTTTTRTFGPHYYNIIPGEFCDSAKLTNCQTTQTATFSYPAAVRWCKATPPVSAEANAKSAQPAAGVCQGVSVGAYTAARYPTKFYKPATAATTYSAAKNGQLVITNISQSQSDASIKCGGTFVGTSANFSTSTSGTTSTRLDALYTSINGKANLGYSVSCTKSTSGSPAKTSKLTCAITAPAGASACATGFALNRITATTNTAPEGEQLAMPETLGSYPGKFERVDIVSGSSYPKAVTRTDCTGAVGPTGCSYTQEMTNFANWWTYYQTRMQTMKTAASLAFKKVGTDFRVGFMTIHPDTAKSVKLDTFNLAHKTAWYNKFFSISPDSATPLRSALATAGRVYANQTTSVISTFGDPIEYACQQNFTLLTTDGMWNTDSDSDVKKVDGSTMTNQDATSATPYYEGKAPSHTSAASLADVAKYYYDTDLRTATLGNCAGALSLSGDGVCQDPSPATTNQRQNMVTLTLGLGVDGELTYTTDYKSAATGDFKAIKDGNLDWPLPVEGTASTIDDLWHAAVNGEGTYFSARNPKQLTSQLKEALAAIQVKVGTGAAAATSTLNPVAGDNFAYVASYTSGNWAGNLEKRSVDIVTGAVNVTALTCVEDVPKASDCIAPGKVVGNACVTTGVTNPALCNSPATLSGTTCSLPLVNDCAGTLKNQSYSARNIKMKSGGGLVDFNFSNVDAAGLGTTFKKPFLEANLTQWPTLASALTPAELDAVAGAKLVDYLRGQRDNEENIDNPLTSLYRKRHAILGDAVNSTPAFIGKPTFSYTDPGYDTFKNSSAASSRPKTVYMGANDGMLHAFDADTLVERWAYVPTMVIHNMWKLADASYASNHAFYVDGDPVISDICVSSCNNASADWRTILVAGLNSGGRGYYALDITDPITPKLLWELNANDVPNLGYSYGRPVITKRPSDGKWVVLLTSGYNNIPDSNAFYGLSSTKNKPFVAPDTAQFTGGDGGGYLFVRDAANGNPLTTIATGEGNTSKPSGLAKINAYADDAEKNNTATYVYGGDLLGNLWRFNISDNTVFNIAQLKASGITQPITTPPELGSVNNKRVLFVGTGKYLEVSDLLDKSQQTLYAIKDDNATSTLIDPRGSTGVLVKQEIVSAGADNRKSKANTTVPNFSTGLGWYVDLPDAGERQNVASQLVLGTLLVPTTVPTASACQPAGYGWFNYFDYKTGLGVTAPDGLISTRTNSPPVGFNVVYIDGKPKVSIVTAEDPTPKLLSTTPFGGSGTGFQKQRSIWRELIN